MIVLAGQSCPPLHRQGTMPRKEKCHDRVDRPAAAGFQLAEPTAIDPVTNRTYVLVPREVYDQLRAILEDDIDMQTVGLLVERAMKEDDANDPYLDSYRKFLP